MDGCAEQTGHVYGCMFWIEVWITELFYTVGVKSDSKQQNYQIILSVSLMADSYFVVCSDIWIVVVDFMLVTTFYMRCDKLIKNKRPNV